MALRTRARATASPPRWTGWRPGRAVTAWSSTTPMTEDAERILRALRRRAVKSKPGWSMSLHPAQGHPSHRSETVFSRGRPYFNAVIVDSRNWRTRGRDYAALSDQVQLHIRSLGSDDRPPRGPSRGRPVVYRVGRRETPRILVC